MDNFSKTQRSKVMAKIRAKNTKPEMIVRKLLHRMGYRYRLHRADLPGKPDVCLPKYKTVIFVHGCFWHAHEGCKYSNLPKSNTNYWIPKIEGNVKRDTKHQKNLKETGWEVIVIWDCELKDIIAVQNKLISSLQKVQY